MRNRWLACRYAQALGELAHEKKMLDDVEQELDSVRRILEDEPAFRKVLQDQRVRHEVKERLLRETFGDRLTQITLNFLLLVVRKNRELHLDEMIDEFHAYADDKRGVVEVEVTTAQPLTDAQAEEVATVLRQVTGRQVRLKTIEDESLLGGIVARIGDLVMDGSARTRLARLRESLKRAQLN